MHEQSESREKLSTEEIRILYRRLQIMQIWTAFLFNNEHRCFMNIICAYTLNQKQITNKQLEIYKGYSDVLADLEKGFMVTTTVQRRGEKRTIIKIHQGFFQLMPNLISAIRAKINPELDKIKKFNPKLKLKRCRNCNAEKSQAELQFYRNIASYACQCKNPDFVDCVIVASVKNRVQQLDKFVNLILQKTKQLEKHEIQFQKTKKSKLEQQEREISEYDKFINRIKSQLLNASIDELKVARTYEKLMIAEEIFAPKKQYEKINEMEEIRWKRKLIKSKQN